MDCYGHHALACAATGSMIVRHNRVRDLVASAGESVGSRFTIEWMTDDKSKERPGDVLWDLLPGRVALIDVAVISVFTNTHRGVILRSGAGHAATEYEQVKRNHYRRLDQSQYALFPFVVESTGAFGRTADKTVDLLEKHDSERNMRHTSRNARSPGLENFKKSVLILSLIHI